jgi:acyl-lipid omega-6 desaturase (Delta-12 desaturase)
MKAQTIKQIKEAIKPECYVVQPRESWLTFLRTFTLVFLFQYLIWLTPLTLQATPLLLCLVFLAGLSFMGIFVLGHDCGHYAFSEKKWVNDVVGTLCHVPIMNGFFAWRVAHDFHHRHTQVRGVDPDWPELLVTKTESPPWHQKLALRLGVGTVLGIVVGFWVGMLKRAFFFLAIPQMKLGTQKSLVVFAHTLFSLALTVLILGLYVEFVGLDKFLVMYAAPALIATSLGALLTFLHHTHKGSFVSDKEFADSFKTQVLGTWNVRFPRWVEWMWLDINIHLPHHLSIRIPWYHLKMAHHQLKTTYPESVQDKDFSLGMLRECWRVTDLEEVEKGLYQLRER